VKLIHSPTARLSLLVLFSILFLKPTFSQAKDNTLSPPEITGIYFTETGCSHCDSFLYVQKAKLEHDYGVSIVLETHDILSAAGYEQCVKMLKQKQLNFTVFPVLFIGSNIYRGSSAIEENMPQEIEYYLAHGSYRPALHRTNELASNADQSDKAFVASIIPSILAGLLDGINPCAFSTMLFFLSFIALKRRDRRSLAWVGISFILAVFVTYFLIGLGFLGALRKYLSENRFSLYVDIFVSALAAIFAVLNVRDAVVATQGRASESLLQMPFFLKRMSHRFIRYFNQLPLYILGAALSGFLVSVIELACTGQIYLPTIAYMNQSARSSRSIILLLIYNVAFIIPLTLVFVLYFFGLRHERIRQWYGTHLVLVRVLSALFFIALGVLVWIP
jgi:cytochrome c biogenesis protein CcdA/glutaredoxin